MIALTHAWGFSREPFGQDIPIKDLYPLPSLAPLIERFDYAVANRMATVITGEVGAGKSTSLRAAVARLHPTQYRIIPVVATTGSLMEFLRQICLSFGNPPTSNSLVKMIALVRALLMEITGKKQIPILIVDEAHLLSLDVFAQLHTFAQVDFDSSTLVPIILSGQTSLIDRLLYHNSRPFTSRLVGRSHMEALQLQDMAAYLTHHLTVAGRAKDVFSDDAVAAIHQSSGGLLRRAGMLARGALLAAAQEKCPLATGEHVRIALTEIL